MSEPEDSIKLVYQSTLALVTADKVTTLGAVMQKTLATMVSYITADERTNLLRGVVVMRQKVEQLDKLVGNYVDNVSEKVINEQSIYNRDDWIQEVTNKDTVLGFREWLSHKVEADQDDNNNAETN